MSLVLSLGWSSLRPFKERFSGTKLASLPASGRLPFPFRRLLSDFYPSLQEKKAFSFRRRGAERHICAVLFQCKHILAIYLCRAMGLTQQESVSDQQMTEILSGADAS